MTTLDRAAVAWLHRRSSRQHKWANDQVTDGLGVGCWRLGSQFPGNDLIGCYAAIRAG